MKRFAAFLMAILMSLSMIACGSKDAKSPETPSDGDTAAAPAPAPAGDEVFELRFSHHNATTDLIHEAAENWAADVAEKTDGKVRITVYPAAQLGNSTEALEAVELGTLDMCLGDASLLTTEIPAYSITCMPFMMSNYDDAFAVFYESDIVDSCDQQMLDKLGVRALGWNMNGFRCMATKTPISSVADCAGIKFRSPETQIYIDTFNMLGFNPVTVSWSEAYTAVQTGIADGVCSATQYLYVNGFYEMCPNICISNHLLSVIGPVANEKVWQSLPAEYQDIIQASWLEVRDDWLNPAVMEGDESYKQELIDAGCTITEFENRQELIDIFKPYWIESAEKGGYSDLMQQTLELLGY